jgi:hypothetical protein
MVFATNCTLDASPTEHDAAISASEQKAFDGGALFCDIPFGFAPMTSRSCFTTGRVSSSALATAAAKVALSTLVADPVALLASLLALRRRRRRLADPRSDVCAWPRAWLRPWRRRDVCLWPRPWLRPRRRRSPPRWRSRLLEVASRRRRAMGR